MVEEIILVPISLDILIPTIAASLIATLVPYSWNKQKENFQHKLRILDEFQKGQKNLNYPLFLFFDLMNTKYRIPYLEKDKFVWKMRNKPLDDKKQLKIKEDNIGEEYSRTFDQIYENFYNREVGYLQLYRTVEMEPLFDKRTQLFFENQKYLFKLSYEPDKIESIEVCLEKIGANFKEIRLVQNDILRLYMKRFRKKYWFARRLQDIKNLKN